MDEHQNTETELAQLLKKIEDALDNDDLPRSSTLLKQIVELEGNNTRVGDHYSRLQQRYLLEEKIREVEAEYTLKLESNSLVDAYQALRDGLYMLADHLPLDNKKSLLEILLIAESSRLNTEESWQAAKKQLAKFRRLGFGNRTSRKVYFLADKLIDLGYNIAVQGIISSTTQMGNLLSAYRTAQQYLYRYPDNEKVFTQFVEIRERFLDQLHNSATKRLSRAEEALKRGMLELAIDEQRDVDELLEQIRQEFPELFGELIREDILNKARYLRQKTERFLRIQAETEPKIEKAEYLIQNEQLEEAEQVLSQIGYIPLANLSERVSYFREQVRKARVDKARNILHTELASVQISLSAMSLKELNYTLDHLTVLPSKINWMILPSEDKEDYDRILEKIYKRLQVMRLIKQARIAVKDGDFEKAYAIITSVSEKDNPEVQAMFKEIEQGLVKQRHKIIETSIKRLLERARGDFQHRRFLSAQRALEKIDTALGQISAEYRILWKSR